MAITSLFYAGDTDTVDWAQGSSRLGYRYAVHGADDFKVSKVTTATHTVSVAPGRASGGGVMDINGDDMPVVLPSVTSGTQWFLVGILRTWQTTNASALAYIAGSSTRQIPPRPTTAGDEDFHPLALVEITAGNTVPTQVVDLRAVGSNSGVLVAQDDLVRSYLTGVGTALRIGDRRWVRITNSSGVASWVDDSEAITITEINGIGAVAEGDSEWARLTSTKLIRDGRRRWLHYEVRRTASAFRAPANGDIANMVIGRLHTQDHPGSIAIAMSGRARSYATSGSISMAGGHLTSDGQIVLNWLTPDFYINGGGAGDGGLFVFDAYWYVG